jgi:hypothetical protein
MYIANNLLGPLKFGVILPGVVLKFGYILSSTKQPVNGTHSSYPTTPLKSIAMTSYPPMWNLSPGSTQVLNVTQVLRNQSTGTQGTQVVELK